jgi:formiminotetrahydrofolate cyclodeaminase
MKLTDRSVRELLDAFAASTPTPGGGSAAALAGAIGASLLAMVAALPKSRAASDDHRARLAGAGARCVALKDALTTFVDADSDAYDRVASAYRLPKETPEDKNARSAAIQEALRQAIAVPLDVMRSCAEGVTLAAVVAELGNASARSDVDVGVELLMAALRGARVNVDINLEGIKEAAYAERVREDAERFERTAARDEAGVREALRQKP